MRVLDIGMLRSCFLVPLCGGFRSNLIFGNLTKSAWCPVDTLKCSAFFTVPLLFKKVGEYEHLDHYHEHLEHYHDHLEHNYGHLNHYHEHLEH